MDLTPAQKARYVGLTTIGAIFVVLVIFLAITWLKGDPTDDLKDRQPQPSPSSTAP